MDLRNLHIIIAIFRFSLISCTPLNIPSASSAGSSILVARKPSEPVSVDFSIYNTKSLALFDIGTDKKPFQLALDLGSPVSWVKAKTGKEKPGRIPDPRSHR